MSRAEKYDGGYLDQLLITNIIEVERGFLNTRRGPPQKNFYYEADVHVESMSKAIPLLVDLRFPGLGEVKELKKGTGKAGWIWRPDSREHAIEFLDRAEDVVLITKDPVRLMRDFLRDREARQGAGDERILGAQLARIASDRAAYVDIHRLNLTPFMDLVPLDPEYISGMWDVKKGGLGISHTQRGPLRAKAHVSHKTVHKGLIDALAERYEASKVYDSVYSENYGVMVTEWHATGEVARRLLLDIEPHARVRHGVIKFLRGFQEQQSVYEARLEKYRSGKRTATVNPDPELVAKIIAFRDQSLRSLATYHKVARTGFALRAGDGT